MGVNFCRFFLALNVFTLLDTFVFAQTPSYLDFSDITQWNSASGCVRSCITSATVAQGLRVGCDQNPAPVTCVCGTDFQDTSSFYNDAGDCAIDSLQFKQEPLKARELRLPQAQVSAFFALLPSITPVRRTQCSPCLGTAPGSTAPSTVPSPTVADAAPSSTGTGGNNGNNGNVNQNVSIGAGSHSGMPQSDKIALGVGLGIGIPTVIFGAWGIWV
ncbi:MAG: hypothetical protein Q9165_008168 [Trypethelium subeluteriae]